MKKIWSCRKQLGQFCSVLGVKKTHQQDCSEVTRVQQKIKSVQGEHIIQNFIFNSMSHLVEHKRLNNKWTFGSTCQMFLLQNISTLKIFPFFHMCRHISNSDLATTLAMCKPIDVSWKVVKVFSAPTTLNTALLSGCGEPCLCRSEIFKEYQS